MINDSSRHRPWTPAKTPVSDVPVAEDNDGEPAATEALPKQKPLRRIRRILTRAKLPLQVTLLSIQVVTHQEKIAEICDQILRLLF